MWHQCLAVVGTTTSANLTFEGDQTSTNGGADAFAVRYSADGTYNWTRVWGGSGIDLGGSIAFNSDGTELFVAGTFRGSVDFGPGPARTAVGLSDFFILELVGFGTTNTVYTYGGIGLELGGSLALDANDDPPALGHAHPDGDVACLRLMYVHPGFLRRGIGTRLLEKASSFMRRQGYRIGGSLRRAFDIDIQKVEKSPARPGTVAIGGRCRIPK